MADRVHPGESPAGAPEKPSSPTPGTYVVHIPKDQVFRVPPPETAAKYQKLTRRHNRRRRSPCCCCLCWLLAIIAAVILIVGIAAAVFYFVCKPKAPSYTVDKVSIKGINVTNIAGEPISPEIGLSVRSENPNGKIGISYENGVLIDVSYRSVSLADGALPAFYQPENNVTVVNVVLKGGRLELGSSLSKELVSDQRRGNVPLRLAIKVPVRVKVWSVESWKFTVKVECNVNVDQLSTKPRIVAKKCEYGVDLLR